MDSSAIIGKFLIPLGLEDLVETFVSNGYELESDILNLEDADLKILGIEDEATQKKIKDACASYRLSDECMLWNFLKENALENYFHNFINCGLTEVRSLRELILSSRVYQDLRIVLPGHQRRLESAICRLTKRRKVAEKTVAIGYWGRPNDLEGATNDFLCIGGTIMSTVAGKPGYNVEFMVDSGSDVVTCPPEIIKDLDLELLGRIESRGVHASMEKFLYKAKLAIGTKVIEVEVMPEAYASVGSRVIRNFRHYITASRHLWLDGSEPEPIK